MSNGADNEIILRLNVEQADMASLRDAYGKMQAISATDNRGWIYWAAYHGFFHYYCWHHGKTGANGTQYPYNLFLPWHRAYLVYWENVAREQNSQATLSWWDWTAQTGVPAAFSQPQVNDGRNSLYSGPTPDMPDDPARQTRRWPGDPADLPSPQDIQTILNLTNFEDFQSQLEDIHDSVHAWTGGINPNNPQQGGDMGVIPAAAFDPIFWAHHCMIDRIWYLWQLRQGVNNIPSAYMQLQLAPFRYTVAQVLDIRQLGYEYASSVATTPVQNGA